MTRNVVGSSRSPRRRGSPSPGPRNIWMIVAVAAVALSVIVLMAVVVNAVSNGDGDTPALPGQPTAEPTDTGAGEPGTATPTSESPVATETALPEATATATLKPGQEFPLVDCLDLYARADKKHIMSPDCAPSDLVSIPDSGEQMRAEAADALIEMIDDAAREGITILAVSGYRSYQTQEVVYASAVEGFGKEYADRTSARPGHSEHQLGTVMDLSTPSEGGQLEESFGTTPAGEWVAENGYKYGFIISYPEGTEAITGYSYEPWHIRYLRPDVARQVKDSGLTITEYLAVR